MPWYYSSNTSISFVPDRHWQEPTVCTPHCFHAYFNGQNSNEVGYLFKEVPLYITTKHDSSQYRMLRFIIQWNQKRKKKMKIKRGESKSANRVSCLCRTWRLNHLTYQSLCLSPLSLIYIPLSMTTKNTPTSYTNNTPTSNS